MTGFGKLSVTGFSPPKRTIMTNGAAKPNRRWSGLRRWIRRGFLLWAVVSTLWLANSHRTRGVADEMLRSSAAVYVVDLSATLEFLPPSSDGKPALIFMCGSGVSAYAHAPLLRPLAEAGYAVFVVKLPYRFAPLESHKQAAVERARSVMAAHPEFPHWVVSGHSLGGALACRVVQADSMAISAMVLIGTTHPKQDDLSNLQMAVTKVCATVTREAQETITRSALLEALSEAGK
jgi:hypothetical protein